MTGDTRYVPPLYIPLSQSDAEPDVVPRTDATPKQKHINDASGQWSSGICACFDDIPSCCIGLVCPCYVFGKNAEFLGSGTVLGSCATHFILWGLFNTFCCVLTDGCMMGLPGCIVACYACGYRKTLRSKYKLEEAPCGDLLTHCFCHLCAICQEYREIRERSGHSNAPSSDLPDVTAPPVQTMELTCSAMQKTVSPSPE